MIINDALLTAVYQNLNMAFRRGLDSAPPPVWQRYATRVPSSTTTEIYPWLKAIPGMREWLGARQWNNLSSGAYSLTNRDWENTIAVGRNDLEDDRIGIYAPAAESLGMEARIHPDVLMAATVEAGDVALCWDGQPYFDTAHPEDSDVVGGTTYSNLFDTAAGTASPLTEANLAARWATFAGYNKESGEPLGLVPDTMMVGSDLAITAGRILNMQTVASASPAGGGSANIQQSNPLQGLVNLVVNPYLTDTGYWYLMVTNRAIKPFLFQERKAANMLVRMDQPNDPEVFNNKTYLYGVDGRYAGGYSFAQLCVRCGP